MTEWITVPPVSGNTLYVNSDEQRYLRIPIVHVKNITNQAISDINTYLLDLTFVQSKIPVDVHGIQWTSGQKVIIPFQANNTKYELRLDPISDLARTEEHDWAYYGHLFVDGRLSDDFQYRRVYVEDGKILNKNK